MLQALGKLCVGGGRAGLVEHVEHAPRRGGRVGRCNQSAGQIGPGDAAEQRKAVDGRRDANVGAPAGLRIPAVHYSVVRTAEIPFTAVGPDPNALIQIRDRLAARAEALARPGRVRWCVGRNVHRKPSPPRKKSDPACRFHVVAAIMLDEVAIGEHAPSRS